MINNLPILENIYNNKFENITKDDCLTYIQVFPWGSALKIKKLISKLPKRCCDCKVKLKSSDLKDIRMDGKWEKICQDCDNERRWMEMWGI